MLCRYQITNCQQATFLYAYNVFDGGSLLFMLSVTGISLTCMKSIHRTSMLLWFSTIAQLLPEVFFGFDGLVLQSILFFHLLFAGRTSFRATKRTAPELDLPMLG